MPSAPSAGTSMSAVIVQAALEVAVEPGELKHSLAVGTGARHCG